MIPRLDCILSPAAQVTLEGLRRTEDIVFSPDGRRLAIAGYGLNRIAIFDVAVVASSVGKKVVLSGVVELASATLHHPHGLCFLDDEAVAVANRTGGVHVYAVPPATGGDSVRRVVEPSQTITGGVPAPIRTPGSVAALPLGSGALDPIAPFDADTVSHPERCG